MFSGVISRQAMKLVAPLPVVWPTRADCDRALSDFIWDAFSDSAFLAPIGEAWRPAGFFFSPSGFSVRT